MHNLTMTMAGPHLSCPKNLIQGQSPATQVPHIHIDYKYIKVKQIWSAI